ncbi:MAG TPA: hypothetical protein DDZ80_16400 [Cyanobacteria bacterium UBA8803]|nr:hypothetical protein [Cyanobacteria bacterium UBA8803]
MTRDSDSAVAYAMILLSHYGFELRGYSPQELVKHWLEIYEPHWIRLAVIEALYQGRYKAVSVEQILSVWSRRGQPIYRFNHEFERLICRKLPQNLAAPFKATLTELNPEPSPLILAESVPDEIDDSPLLEVSSQEEPLPILASDNLPSAMTEITEVSETELQEDYPMPEVPTNGNINVALEIDWSRGEANKNPIHQFTPPPDSSGFYLKLKKVVEQQDGTPADILTPGESD